VRRMSRIFQELKSPKPLTDAGKCWLVDRGRPKISAIGFSYHHEWFQNFFVDLDLIIQLVLWVIELGLSLIASQIEDLR